MTFSPKPFSVAEKAADLLRDEGPLTAAVIADRLGQHVSTVRSCLLMLRSRGAVTRVRNNDGHWVYIDGGVGPEPDGEGFPVQRTVPAVNGGVDIDLIHRNRLWQTAPTAEDFECALLFGGRLRITLMGTALTLDPAQAQALRQFFAETA